MTSKRDYCSESDNGSFCCTERPGHTGDHEARTAPGGRVAHRWPNVSPTTVEFRPGDRVRVTVEGQVLSEGSDSFKVDAGSYMIVARPDSPGVSVELLSRRCPQVGDVLTGAEIEALPVTSIIEGRYSRYRFARSARGWVSLEAYALADAAPHGEHRVLYVPSSVPDSSGETS